MSNRAKVDAALASWVSDNEVVAERANAYDDKVVLVRRCDLYAIYRGFMIGDTAHVSADLQDVPADEAFKYLMEHMEF